MRKIAFIVSDGAACGFRALSVILPPLPSPLDSMVSFDVVVGALNRALERGAGGCIAAA